ncbi:hypothetical protein PGT21_000574 [Puccinia graminis f. sp. tritici]|uniref:Uncharacterized protein n=1 Tax=Puccinia graminis f. sp. tritici TaxID=56615 RepID=A0A5B0QA67_PUCGR|nr:hypothetical protein PGT21_000574 [Puccinia graminis f. sp. tritici]
MSKTIDLGPTTVQLEVGISNVPEQVGIEPLPNEDRTHQSSKKSLHQIDFAQGQLLHQPKMQAN